MITNKKKIKVKVNLYMTREFNEAMDRKAKSKGYASRASYIIDLIEKDLRPVQKKNRRGT